MTPLLSQHVDDIASLCREHRVKRLDVFGSAARDDFDPEASDVDFIVEFEAMSASEKTQHFFDLLEGLETLLGREIDLISNLPEHNYAFRDNVAKSRVQLYAA